MRRCIDATKRPVASGSIYVYQSYRQISAQARGRTNEQHAPLLLQCSAPAQSTRPRQAELQRKSATHSHELQASLHQWAGLESRWQRLDRGRGVLQQKQNWYSTLRQEDEAAEPSVKANRKNKSDAVNIVSTHEQSCSTPDWIEKADLIEITSLFSDSPEQCCAPETLPMLLQRIATLHPPAPSAKQNERQPVDSRNPRSISNKDAGILVRAMLAHTKQHLSSLDTVLLADIFAGASKLSHLHGMHLWFSQGGAGGMGIRSLQVLATRASDLPAAHVASVISALGRLGTGEQVPVHLACVRSCVWQIYSCGCAFCVTHHVCV